MHWINTLCVTLQRYVGPKSGLPKRKSGTSLHGISMNTVYDKTVQFKTHLPSPHFLAVSIDLDGRKVIGAEVPVRPVSRGIAGEDNGAILRNRQSSPNFILVGTILEESSTTTQCRGSEICTQLILRISLLTDADAVNPVAPPEDTTRPTRYHKTCTSQRFSCTWRRAGQVGVRGTCSTYAQVLLFPIDS